MSAEFFKTSERLLSATANGVYQGVIVALLAGLALRLFPRTNAATRHAVWFGVLLFVTALIPAHLFISLRPRPEIPPATVRAASITTSVGVAPLYFGRTMDLTVSDPEVPDAQSDKSDESRTDGAPFFSDAGLPHKWASREIDSTGLPETVAKENARSIFPPALLKPFGHNLETAIRLPHWVCLCLVSAWVLLASVRGGLIAGRILEVRGAKRMSSAPSHGLQTLFERLRDSLATRRNVRLRISNAHRSAVVLGFLHPVVLLPAEMDDDANDGEVEHVLRHELAHVERGDDWGNLAQHLIQAAMFFHPAVWWISPKLSLEREIACDDYVLDASGRPRAYALTLANVASRMNRCGQLLAPGVSNNSSQLQQRITMILNTQRDRSPRLARSRLGIFTAATAMLAVLAIDAGPRLVLAQSPEPSPAAPAPEDAAFPPTPVVIAAPVTLTTTVLAAAPATTPPDWSGAESGPRPKAQLSDDDSTTSISPPDSIPAPPPVRELGQAPALPAAVSVYPVAPVSPASDMSPMPRSPKRHMSIEERLDRIERILDDLEARGELKGRRNGDGYKLYGRANGQGTAYGLVVDPNDVAKGHNPGDDVFLFQMGQNRAAAQEQKAQTDALFAEQKRTSEQALRELEEGQRAVEVGQRAMEESQRAAERTARDFAKQSKDFQQQPGELREMESEGQLKALQALRDASQSLQAQVKTLEKQIKRLEEEQNRPKKPGRSNDSDQGSKEKTPSKETPETS